MIFFQVWNSLVTKKGTIRKATGDYAVRKGLTQKPLADIEFVGKYSFHICCPLFLTEKQEYYYLG